MNIKLHLHSIVLLLAMGMPSFAQDDDKIKPNWVSDPIKLVPKIEKMAAKEAVKTFKAEYKVARTDEARIACIDKLAANRHPSIASTLGKLLLRTKSEELQIVIADRLANIGDDKASLSLQKVLLNKKNYENTELIRATGRALGSCSKKSLVKKLKKELDRGPMRLKRGVVLCWGHAKDKAALEELKDWIQRPQPKDVNSGTNPPASYWKERYRNWNFIQKQVIWAMWNITGEVFESASEVDAWIAEDKKKKKAKKKAKSKEKK